LACARYTDYSGLLEDIYQSRTAWMGCHHPNLQYARHVEDCRQTLVVVVINAHPICEYYFRYLDDKYVI
jgi:hypothetical protein